MWRTVHTEALLTITAKDPTKSRVCGVKELRGPGFRVRIKVCESC